MMILRFFLLLGLLAPAFAQDPPPSLLPGQVAVVYNSEVPASRELAEFYAINRRIPMENLIGLSVTEKSTIDRNTYQKTIRDPLVRKFIEAKWWEMGKSEQGVVVPVESQIRCLVMLKGMPLRIKQTPPAEGAPKKTIKDRDESAVDSELSLMGVPNYQLGGPFSNPYFKKDFPASRHPFPNLVLVGRIDAHSYDHCRRMILDAIDTEKEGLWGRAYIDLWTRSGAYAVGDEWMEKIATLTREMDHPTIVDRMKNTYVSHYPMRDAAVYFGWYVDHRNGPFLNPDMTFQRGAIAAHLHSFSATQLINPEKNWSAALIDRGAAATLGNTWEPYLQASHHFDIFYERLTRGFSLVEASYMSMNVLSWQNIVIGDPLYKPYKVTKVERETLDKEREYKLIRYARARFPDPEKRLSELLKVAASTGNGSVFEMIGFDQLAAGEAEEARKAFRKAREIFTEPADKLRQELNLVEVERREENIAEALSLLKEAKTTYDDLPEAKAIDGLLTILDPPPPPATKR